MPAYLHRIGVDKFFPCGLVTGALLAAAITCDCWLVGPGSQPLPKLVHLPEERVLYIEGENFFAFYPDSLLPSRTKETFLK